MNADGDLNDVLRRLPSRRAPATLESRVLRELERRTARPWWFRRFALWPAGARAAFVAICCAIIGLTFRDGAWTAVTQVWSDAGTESLSWTRPAVAATMSARELAMLLMRVIPTTWIYVGLATGAALYVALFGLSAAAYRTLYLQASPAGTRP